MMNRLKGLLVLLCVCFTAGGAEYHNQTVRVSHFDYSSYTVTYTDADGVVRTVPLTAEATTPEHMMALLNKIYTDPTIPGIHYGYDYGGTQYRKIDYNYFGHLGNPQWLSKNATFPNPYDNGMTLLQVSVREDWKISYHGNYQNDLDYFRAAISSIRLVTEFTRVQDSVNPGYLFTVDGATNRFFFISKGKARNSYTKPFYRCFEQISPVNAMTGDQATESFIDDMRSGQDYYCYHDCSNVTSMTGGHWFTISTAGENYSLNNLAIFIPDRRFEYIHDTTQTDRSTSTFYVSEKDKNHQYYNEYGNSHNVGEEDWDLMPRVLMYNAYLTGKVKRSSERGYFTIHLDWESALSGMSVPEHYYIYQIDAQGNRTLLTTIATQPTMEHSHEYDVPQQLDPQTFHYICTAAPINYESDGVTVALDSLRQPLRTLSADSRVCTLTVPGIDPYFSEASDYRSRYDAPNEVNIYKNTVEVSPTTSDDYLAIRNNQEAFELVRTDAAGTSVTVATVRFTLKADESGYDYVVHYNDSTQNTTLTFDDEVPATSGEFSNIDDATVRVIDRFTASTATNSHSAGYTYTLKQDGGRFSNSSSVPVYKTTNAIAGYGYTAEEVEADTLRSLEKGPFTSVTFDAINDPLANLVQYEIVSIDNSLNLSTVGKAENFNNSGNYCLFGLSRGGYLNDQQGWVSIPSTGGSITITDRNNNSSKNCRYVPVIQTQYKNDATEENTYGCNIQRIEYPSVSISISNLEKSQPFAGPGMRQMGYQATVRLKPNLKSNINTVYFYRLWRQVTGAQVVDELTLLNEHSTPGAEDYGADYSVLRSVLPGSNTINIHDVFIDKAIGDGEELKVRYYVRLYAMPASALEGAPRRAPGDDHDIFISENNNTATFNNSVATGVISVYDVARPTETVRYFDLVGRYVGTSLDSAPAGIYIGSDGKKVVK